MHKGSFLDTFDAFDALHVSCMLSGHHTCVPRGMFVF